MLFSVLTIDGAASDVILKGSHELFMTLGLGSRTQTTNCVRNLEDRPQNKFNSQNFILSMYKQIFKGNFLSVDLETATKHVIDQSHMSLDAEELIEIEHYIRALCNKLHMARSTKLLEQSSMATTGNALAHTYMCNKNIQCLYETGAISRRRVYTVDQCDESSIVHGSP